MLIIQLTLQIVTEKEFDKENWICNRRAFTNQATYVFIGSFASLRRMLVNAPPGKVYEDVEWNSRPDSY